jgi:glucosamine-6-phosphate deaminase
MSVKVIAEPDYRQMSLTAAQFVAGNVRELSSLNLCLPVGKTPQGMYQELIRLHRSEGLDFSDVKIFQLDEFADLPPDHPRNFKSFLCREFLDHVNVRRANIHVIDENFESAILAAGRLDLVVLGIGVNGHVGFNEPGAALDSRTRIVDLADSTIETFRQMFSPEEMPRRAITIGLGTIMDAARVLLLASGTGKAAVLARALNDPVTSDIPASILQTHANATVIADSDALQIYKGGVVFPT